MIHRRLWLVLALRQRMTDADDRPASELDKQCDNNNVRHESGRLVAHADEARSNENSDDKQESAVGLPDDGGGHVDPAVRPFFSQSVQAVSNKAAGYEQANKSDRRGQNGDSPGQH